jgi:MFS family permease
VLTLLGALAPDFPLFFLGRAAAGITEFAMIPIVYSLIPDLVGERLRVGANLTFAALMAVGASAGFYLGGDLLQFMAEIDGPGVLAGLAPWRRTMALLALAGLPLLLLGTLTLDPPRHAEADIGATAPASLAGFLRSHLRQVLLFVGAAGGVAIAVQAVVPMIAMALERRFVADLGTIGHTLGMLTLAGTMISLPIAWLVDRTLRGRLGVRARPALMGAATAIAVPCAVLLAFAPSTSVALALTGAFLLTTCVANALLPTMLQDLAPVALRARAFAGYSFLIAAFCALGPVLAGGISQFLLGDDLLSAISLAAVPPMALTLVCTALWCLRPGRTAPH